MNSTLKTVLISLCTSICASLFTFTLGLRSGKNQADRQKLQGLYKELLNYFIDLKLFIQEDKCKTWKCYDHTTRGSKNVYTPPVRKMEYSGDLLFLQKQIAKKAKTLEDDIMKFGKDNDAVGNSIHEVIVNNLQLFKDGYQFGDEFDSDQRNYFTSLKTQEYNAEKNIPYRELLNQEKFKQYVSQWDSQADYKLSFSGGVPPICQLRLYPNSLSVSASQFTETLIKEFKEKVPGYAEYESRKSELIKRIEKLIKCLRKRTKEPVSFWETIFGAFADIFR